MHPRTAGILVFAALALAMAATRLPMTAEILHLQDASWAVFFLAGFYLSAQWRRALPALMALAVAVDYTAIRYLGIPNYCLTVAYWFLVPSYAALWAGGAWLRRQLTLDLRGACLAPVALVASVSLCFLVSNGSFYWLGAPVEKSWAGWMANLAIWYGPFLKTPLVYVAVVALLHGIGGALGIGALRLAPGSRAISSRG